MRRGEWQVMQGLGASNLLRISGDVMRRNGLSEAALNAMQAQEEELEASAFSAANTIVRDAPQERLTDLDGLVEELDETQKDQIVRAYMARSVVARMNSDRGGTRFGQSRLGRLTVMEAGVIGERKWASLSRDAEVSETGQEIEPGTVIEGIIWDFSSKPEVGGVIQLDHILRTSVIQGLVDPTNGKQRVELDILCRDPS